jgi:hypothetical protein
MKLPNFGWMTLRCRPITPSPAATATVLCATTQIRSLGKWSISWGKPTEGLSARYPASWSAWVTLRAAWLACSSVWWNSWLATLRAGERQLSRFIRNAIAIRVRVPGSADCACSRSPARSGWSRLTAAASSAPAARQSSRSQAASITAGGRATSPAARRASRARTDGCAASFAGSLSSADCPSTPRAVVIRHSLVDLVAARLQGEKPVGFASL